MSAFSGNYYWSYEIGSQSERAITEENNNITVSEAWFSYNMNEDILESTYINLFEDLNYDIEQEIYEDDELYNCVEEMYQVDRIFLDSIKEHKKYYIGNYTIIESNTACDPFEMLLNCCISPKVFFENSFLAIKTYLYEFSVIYKNSYLFNNSIEIMQLYINHENDSYNVVLKTVWLRIFQRKWRKWNVNRKNILHHRMKLSSLRHFEINGKWPVRS